MTKKIGLWIDHRKAFIITLTSEDETLHVIESYVERKPRPAGGARSKVPYGPQDAVAEDRLEKRYEHQIKRYIDSVISYIKDADSIFIFGPGMAKIELKKELERQAPHCNVAGIETTDKMTAAEIKSNVRQFFRVEQRN